MDDVDRYQSDGVYLALIMIIWFIFLQIGFGLFLFLQSSYTLSVSLVVGGLFFVSLAIKILVFLSCSCCLKGCLCCSKRTCLCLRYCSPKSVRRRARQQRVIGMTPGYGETEDQVKKTLDSYIRSNIDCCFIMERECPAVTNLRNCLVKENFTSVDITNNLQHQHLYRMDIYERDDTSKIIVVEKTKEGKGKKNSQILFMRMKDMKLNNNNTISEIYSRVLFVDNDTSFEPSCVEHLKEILEINSSLGMVSAPYYAPSSPFFRESVFIRCQAYESAISHLQKLVEDSVGFVTCVPGAFCMLRSKIFFEELEAYCEPPVRFADKVVHELGEDRYMTALVLSLGYETGTSSFLKLMITGEKVRTGAKPTIMELILQRKRWYNSTFFTNSMLFGKLLSLPFWGFKKRSEKNCCYTFFQSLGRLSYVLSLLIDQSIALISPVFTFYLFTQIVRKTLELVPLLREFSVTGLISMVTLSFLFLWVVTIKIFHRVEQAKSFIFVVPFVFGLTFCLFTISSIVIYAVELHQFLFNDSFIDNVQHLPDQNAIFLLMVVVVVVVVNVLQAIVSTILFKDFFIFFGFFIYCVCLYPLFNLFIPLYSVLHVNDLSW